MNMAILSRLNWASDCRAIAVREGGHAPSTSMHVLEIEQGIEGGHACAIEEEQKMRLNPSTSGGAAESTSSMYACNPPEGPSMCQRSPRNRSLTPERIFIFFYPPQLPV